MYPIIQRSRLAVLTVFLSFILSPLFSQTVIEKTPEKKRVEWYQQHVQMGKESLLKNLR